MSRPPGGQDPPAPAKVVLHLGESGGNVEADDEVAVDEDLAADLMKVNLGPSHPATHGVVHLVVTLEGERIRDADVELGFMHRCFEKESEYATYTQVFPYTDRLNYVSPILNNVGFAMAVEKALGITARIPERAQYLRVITGELSRITDHLTCVGATAMELGAFTPFLWLMKVRDWLYDCEEAICGARITSTYCRVGGVVADLPAGWPELVRRRLDDTERALDEAEALLTTNRIFRDRMEGVAAYSAKDALADGWTGPCLRSTGVDYDVRKDHPYLVYDRLEFDVPVGTHGDAYDRYLVRMVEMHQSARIVRQALDQLPPGPILIDEPRVTMPTKAEVYNTIEGMIRQFKLVMDGIKVPPGEVYSYTEAGNGELGFYLVADGTGRPYRCHCRAPAFAIMQSFSRLIQGRLLPDIVPAFGQVNYIAGEVER